jgi:hypothetical protein
MLSVLNDDVIESLTCIEEDVDNYSSSYTNEEMTYGCGFSCISECSDECKGGCSWNCDESATDD